MLPGFRNDFGFAVQQLDADQLDEEFNRPASDKQNEIRMGVEIDGWSRPVAYWMWDAHPFDFQGGRRRNRIRVPADQLIHRYQIRRPGQTRGVSWFAPVLMDAQMLSALQEAELIASRISAAKSGLFEYEDPSAVPDPNLPSGATQDFTWDMEPGVWETMPPGLKPHFFDPTHPNGAFEGFNKIILHTIAAGLKTSYHSLTGDLREVNFSSIRQGTLQERDIYRRLQRRTWTQVHRPVFRNWLKWALTTRAINLPFHDFARLERHEWQGRGWPWVDPLKDIKAAELAIKLGLDSRTRLAAEQGRDFAEILDQLAHERDLAARKGIDIGAEAGGDALLNALLGADDDAIAEAGERLNGQGSRIAGLLTGGASDANH